MGKVAPECAVRNKKSRVPCIIIFVSPCVGGSKAPPRTLYRIKCVLAEQFIQTANYYADSIPW